MDAKRTIFFCRNIVSSFVLAALVGIRLLTVTNTSYADEIEALKRKLEYLEQRQLLIIKLKILQQEIDALDEKFSDLANSKKTPSKPTPQKQTESASKEINFEWSMGSLSKETRTVTGLSIGDRPFGFNKRTDGWYAVHQLSGVDSHVAASGNNKIVMEGFPPDWPVRGIWIFKKTPSFCKLNHEDDNQPNTVARLEIKWKCGW